MNKPRRAPRRRVDGVLLLDKPPGMTSNAALQKARWLFNAEKAGHTGTLDPMATGLLPICFGEATKFSGMLLDADKTYLATVQLGVVTDTADAEGKVLETRPVHASESTVRETLKRFIGEIDQVPPMYSALKRDGKPLYELARQGIEVEREARRVTIHSLEMTAWDGDCFNLMVSCSKGTYIRSLAADLGVELGCGAMLAALRRCQVGNVSLPITSTLTQIEHMTSEERDNLLRPVDSLLMNLPVATLSDADSERFCHGQSVPVLDLCDDLYRVYGTTKGFLGLGIGSLDGQLFPKRLVSQ